MLNCLFVCFRWWPGGLGVWMHPGYVSFCRNKSLNKLTLLGSFFPAFSLSADFLKINSKKNSGMLVKLYGSRLGLKFCQA